MQGDYIGLANGPLTPLNSDSNCRVDLYASARSHLTLNFRAKARFTYALG
jgi:hypothetical protein